jgi:hypothetical protein
MCSVSDNVCFVCLFLSFLSSFVLSRLHGTILLHITAAVFVPVCREKNFIVFISQFSWPEQLNILLQVCSSFYNEFGEFLFYSCLYTLQQFAILCVRVMNSRRLIDMGRSCSTCENEKCIQMFVQTKWKEEASWRPMYRWKDTINTDFR